MKAVWIGLALIVWLCIGWYLESEAYERREERREIDRMADESRTRKPKANRSARWVQKSPRLAGRG